jgi:hypothetical protein
MLVLSYLILTFSETVGQSALPLWAAAEASHVWRISEFG